MGLFGPSENKHKVSEKEFDAVKSRLYTLDFTRSDLDKISMIFRADLHEPEDLQKGIDSGELERGITWMKENTHIHKIAERKIDVLERLLRARL